MIDGVVYKIADCQEEREAAFRLIHDAYMKSGLMEPNAAGMRVTPHHCLPTTDLFVAYHGDQLIYTMSLISDDAMGLPLERVYEGEVNALRQSSGDYLAEVSCLAAREGHFPRGRMYQVFVRLAGLMVQSARENGVERLLIACHPRHARFYKNFLGFKQFGEQLNYSVVKNHPAVACQHDFALLDSERYKLYDKIYEYQFPYWELYHQPMLQEHRDYFAEITELCNAFFPLTEVA